MQALTPDLCVYTAKNLSRMSLRVRSSPTGTKLSTSESSNVFDLALVAVDYSWSTPFCYLSCQLRQHGS